MLREIKKEDIARVEAALLKGARKYFDDKDFVEVVSPHITKATGACENIDTLFAVNYFGKPAYLSQTQQLYMEALIPQLKNVWAIGPSFRAEPEADNRHLTEFPLVELEFAGNFEELLKHVEGIVSTMIEYALKEPALAEITDVSRLQNIRSFARITYDQAIEKVGGKWGEDLKSSQEKALAAEYGRPLFITHFPKAIKFFNMRENDYRTDVVNSADLILPGSGEAVGAAERENRYNKLEERLRTSPMLQKLVARGGSIDDFSWYLNLVKAGDMPLHSGCGIGLNRVTQYVLGVDDIRKSTVFPLNSETLF